MDTVPKPAGFWVVEKRVDFLIFFNLAINWRLTLTFGEQDTPGLSQLHSHRRTVATLSKRYHDDPKTHPGRVGLGSAHLTPRNTARYPLPVRQ